MFRGVSWGEGGDPARPVAELMDPMALKSRIMAAYVNAERRPAVADAGWDVHRDYENVRCEDVARWLIDNAPRMWDAWCQKYNMRFDPERDEFIDLTEWGFRLANRDEGWKS